MSIKRIEIDVLLDDDSEHHLTISNPSLVAWDRQRALRNWPTAIDAPQVWATFLAWHHMKAHGLVTCELKDFEETHCLAATFTDDEQDAADVDPTPPAPEPDFASS